MDEYLAFAARYNRGANHKMIETLSSMEAAALEEGRGSHFGSLHGLLDHIVGGEFFVLKLIKGALPDHAALAIRELELEMRPGLPLFPTFEAATKALASLDEAYVALATSDEPGFLEKEIPVRGTARKLGSLLVSASSHAAHHRGQVSQVLDELKIENDFYAAFKEID